MGFMLNLRSRPIGKKNLGHSDTGYAVVGRRKRKIYASSLATLVVLLPFAFSMTKALESQGYVCRTHLHTCDVIIYCYF